MQGTVKFFDEKKGWGFIVRGEGPDIFVHQSSIKMIGRRFLTVGQVVEFDEITTERGYEAKNVLLKEAATSTAPDDSGVYRELVVVNLDALRLSAENHHLSLRELIYDAFDAAVDKLLLRLEEAGEIPPDDDEDGLAGLSSDN
jgi:CspA family cold shock protein